MSCEDERLMRIGNAREDVCAMTLVVCYSSVRERNFFTFKASTIKQSYHPDGLVKSCMKRTSADGTEE